MSSDPLAGLTKLEIMNADTPISLVGEIGSGKGYRARLIHEARVGKGEEPPLLRVALHTLDNGDMMWRELFGIGKGMATGVDQGPGVFESAGEGTVFLDELHLAPIHVQRQLLTVLDERTVRRRGENRARLVRAKLITGSHRPLDALVADGTLVPDLFSRLEAGPEIVIPALRDADAEQFVAIFAAVCLEVGFDPLTQGMCTRLWTLTQQHTQSAWPGNVRQLEAAVTWARNGRSMKYIERRLVASWSAQPSEPVREVAVGQLQSLMPVDADIRLLADLLTLSIPSSGAASGERSAASSPSKGGRPTKIAKHAVDIADLLMDERGIGTLRCDLEDLIGRSKGPRLLLDRALDTWVGQGILQPARRGGQDAFLLIWPLVDVFVTVERDGRSHGWSPVSALGAADIVRIHVRSRLRCRVRIATLAHPVVDELCEDDVGWGDYEDADGEPVHPERHVVAADGHHFVEWDMPFTLDDTPGWEQYIVHLVPELPPSDQRGPTRGRPRTRRSALDINAVLLAREIVKRRWGRGWMTDFIVRKKDPAAS